MRKHRLIRKVAVLGAGVMGAQIAAHFVNAGIPVLLYDLPRDEGPVNGLADRAIQRLAKIKPPPLMDKQQAYQIQAANYQQDLERLKECDLVIEAIAEQPGLKQTLYQKIAPFIATDTILASNTSGLSINTLATHLPEAIRPRFCGVHFFNPPRYMKLVELIPGELTQAELLDDLETFLVTRLGKGVVRAKDTPNFIGNRIGVFSMVSTLYHTQQLNLGFDVVDALTGPKLGRPKSATYRTFDVVGLDTLAHVLQNMAENLTQDPWHEFFQLPAWLQQLIDGGALGQKTGKGIYWKQGKQITVLDRSSGEYHAIKAELDDQVKTILAVPSLSEKIFQLRDCEHPQAQFLWRYFLDLFHYCAVHGAAIADSVRDIDLAIRWGFGWQQGPFEIWQACGWERIAQWLQQEIQQGKTMQTTPLPDWVMQIKAAYNRVGAYQFKSGQYEAASSLPVYQRQLFPPAMVGQHSEPGETIIESEDFRLWQQDDIAIATFKSKHNIITEDVLEQLTQATVIVEQDFAGLVIWQGDSEHFCYGADLKTFGQKCEKNSALLEELAQRFQRMVLALRYMQKPVVAAVRGMAFGGGVEVLLHCDRIVAAAESYIGLVEAGVGILPASGGSKEMALRASQLAQSKDPFDYLQQFFQQIAMAKVTMSAAEAKQFHYLRESDVIVMNADELLYAAKAQVRALNAAGYCPPTKPLIKVVGKPGIATLQMFLVNLYEGGFISSYDKFLGTQIARVLCGGEVEANSLVTEEWMLQLEREALLILAQQTKTQERIQYTLKTGKPLRN